MARRTIRAGLWLLLGCWTLVCCASGCSSLALPIAQGDPSLPFPEPELPEPEPEPEPEPQAPRFSTDIAPILGASCGISGCHAGSNPILSLNLTPAMAYASTVNVPSLEVPALMRIAPGDPDNSYLIQKIEGTNAVGERMPFGGPYLDDATIQLIRDWVTAGALND